jgi:hypothetical protein
MEELFNKLTELSDMLKAIKSTQDDVSFKVPPIKGITPPAMTATAPSKPIAPAPESKKDPKKIAEQIKDGSMSTKTQKPLLKIDQKGQWSLVPHSDI